MIPSVTLPTSSSSNNPPPTFQPSQTSPSSSHQQHSLSSFIDQKHSLHLPASQIASLCGYHPYTHLPSLLLSLIYQSSIGQSLLHHDASLLNLTLISDDEKLDSIAAKDATVARMLKRARTSRPSSVEDAQRIKNDLLTTATKSGKLTERDVTELSNGVRQCVDTAYGTRFEDEALDLYETMVGWEVRERNAELREWCFEMRDDDDDDDDEGGVKTVVPMGEAVVRRRKRRRRRQQEEEEVVVEVSSSAKAEDDGGLMMDDGKRRCKDNGVIPHSPSDETPLLLSSSSNEDDVKRSLESPHQNNNNDNDNDTTSKKPYFIIRGAIDGIRDELYQRNNNNDDDDDDDDNWCLRPIVIECKHRMKQSSNNPPPLYDQIQAVVYCYMYCVDEAEIIHVVRRQQKIKKQHDIVDVDDDNDDDDDVIVIEDTTDNSKDDNDDNYDTKKNVANNNHDKKSVSNELTNPSSSSITTTTKKKNKNRTSVDITPHRISLNDQLYNHGHNFHNVILPRLRSFVDAVYAIRSDDGLRYRLLMALAMENETDSWGLLMERCVWLKDCDVAFYREEG